VCFPTYKFVPAPLATPPFPRHRPWLSVNGDGSHLTRWPFEKILSKLCVDALEAAVGTAFLSMLVVAVMVLLRSGTGSSFARVRRRMLVAAVVRVPVTDHVSNNLVNGVAQWLERRSLSGGLSLI